MGLSKSYKKVSFSLELIPYDGSQIMVSAILTYLIDVFSRLEKQYVEITTSPSLKYRLVDRKFVKMDYASSSTATDISEDFVSFNGTDPIVWRGFIELDSSKLKDQLRALSCKLYWHYSDKCQFSVRWSFDHFHSNPFVSLGETRSMRGFHRCKSFAFGNIINGNRFMARFDSLKPVNPLPASSQDSIKDISLEMVHHIKQLNLQFTIDSRKLGSTNGQKFKLVYKYDSITQVTISSISWNDHSIHLTTSQPPKIFRLNHSKPNQSNWTRWYDCDLIPQDTIGKSSVLRLTGVYFHPIVQSLHTARRFLNVAGKIDIFFGNIPEYFVKKSYEKSLTTVNYQIMSLPDNVSKFIIGP